MRSSANGAVSSSVHLRQRRRQQQQPKQPQEHQEAQRSPTNTILANGHVLPAATPADVAATAVTVGAESGFVRLLDGAADGVTDQRGWLDNRDSASRLSPSSQASLSLSSSSSLSTHGWKRGRASGVHDAVTALCVLVVAPLAIALAIAYLIALCRQHTCARVFGGWLASAPAGVERVLRLLPTWLARTAFEGPALAGVAFLLYHATIVYFNSDVPGVQPPILPYRTACGQLRADANYVFPLLLALVVMGIFSLPQVVVWHSQRIYEDAPALAVTTTTAPLETVASQVITSASESSVSSMLS